MQFPQTPIYNDGVFSILDLPCYKMRRRVDFFIFRNELNFGFYQEKEGEVLFEKEVSLG